MTRILGFINFWQSPFYRTWSIFRAALWASSGRPAVQVRCSWRRLKKSLKIKIMENNFFKNHFYTNWTMLNRNITSDFIFHQFWKTWKILQRSCRSPGAADRQAVANDGPRYSKVIGDNISHKIFHFFDKLGFFTTYWHHFCYDRNLTKTWTLKQSQQFIFLKKDWRTFVKTLVKGENSFDVPVDDEDRCLKTKRRFLSVCNISRLSLLNGSQRAHVGSAQVGSNLARKC